MSIRVLKAAALAGIATFATLGFVASASAADLLVNNAPTYDPVSPAGAWDGLWLGAFAGYGWGTVTNPDGAFGTTDDFDAKGWLVGVNATANFSLGNGVVVGAITDAAWSDLSGEDGDLSYSIDWLASARGKLGWDAGTFLPYLTGGLAVAGATVEYDGDKDQKTHLGWTVGAGVDVALTENINLTAEYRYSDYGTSEYDVDKGTDIGLKTNTVTAGISFKF